jgi:uncharacterized repeat protein (TIGR01451 family)
MTFARLARPASSCRSVAATAAAVCLALLAFARPAPAAAEARPSAELDPRQFGVDVDVKKDAEYAAPLCPNGNIRFTVRITNNSFGIAVAQVLDPIPNGTTYVQGSAGGGAFHDAINDRIVWQGLLLPGQTHSIGFSVTVNPGMAGATILNVATGRVVVGEIVAQDQDQVAVSVGCGPLAVTVTKDRHLALPLCPGSNIHYTIRITNHSSRDRLLDARIEDPVPANAEFAGSLTPNTRLENNTVVWEGKLGPGQSHQIGFSVRVPGAAPDGTPINNRATGRLEDPVVGDAAQDVHEVVDVVDCPESELSLDLKKTSRFDGPLCPGTPIRYEAVLTNTSEAEGLLEAELIDPLPANTTFVGALSPPEAAFADGRVTWQGQLAQGQSRTVAFDVTVNPGVPDGSQIVNTLSGLVREPVTGFSATAEDRAEDTVECVEEVKASEPAIDLEIWLKYVEFEDDTDHFLNGNGDMIGLAAVGVEGDSEVQSTALGGVDGNAPEGRVELLLPISDEPSTEDGKKIFSKALCCTDFDIELAVDFWDVDPSNSELQDKIKEMAEVAREVLPDSKVSAAERIAAALAKLLDTLGLSGPDHLGFYGNKDLKTPWVVKPETFSCPLRDAVMDGDRAKLTNFEQGNPDFLDRPHTLRFRRGGKDNGEIWLEWKGYPDVEAQENGPNCNKVRRGGVGGEGEDKVARFLGAETPTPGAGSPALRLLTFATLQASERELDLTWTFEPPAGYSSLADVLADRGPVSLHGLLTTPRNAAAATPPEGLQAWRAEVHLRVEAGSVVAEAAVSRWQESEWIETGAVPLEIQVADGLVQATFDHRDLGELASYSLSAEVFEAGAVADALPESPGLEYLLTWKPDRMPPLVRSVHEVPSEPTEGPAGELLPRGSVDRIVIELSERVELTPGDVRLEPSVDVDLFLDGRTLTVEPREVLGAGNYELVLAGGISDTGGNRLDGNVDGTPGDDFRYALRVIGFRFLATDSRGARKTLFATGEEIYASGFGFTPGGNLDLYLMPAHLVSNGAALEDFTSDGVSHVTTGPAGDLDAVSVGAAPEPGEYSLIADVDRDGRFQAAVDRQWREPGIGVGVVDDGEDPELPTLPEPPPGPWLTSPELPGFEAKVRITPRGGELVAGAAEPFCIVESLCVSGALPGRPEVFVKVIGPRPNGKLWVQISRFTPSEVEVWLRQVATGIVRYYRLEPVGATSDDVSGLQDREAFDPAGAASTVPRGAVLPGAAVEPFAHSSMSSALGPRLEPGEPEPPQGLDWLTTPELPGFRFKALITPAGGQGVAGRGVDLCIPETLCIQGVLAGRPEVFAKIIGPRPNGFLWVQAARFTPSRVELWVEQEGSGALRYYRLEPIGPGVDDVSGLQDREAFAPKGGTGTGPAPGARLSTAYGRPSGMKRPATRPRPRAPSMAPVKRTGFSNRRCDRGSKVLPSTANVASTSISASKAKPAPSSRAASRGTQQPQSRSSRASRRLSRIAGRVRRRSNGSGETPRRSERASSGTSTRNVAGRASSTTFGVNDAPISNSPRSYSGTTSAASTTRSNPPGSVAPGMELAVSGRMPTTVPGAASAPSGTVSS